MKKYYYIDAHNQQQGPFDMEELRLGGITRATKVWFEGLPNWESADKIAELAPLFMGIPPQTPPPPIYSAEPRYVAQPAMERPKTWLIESILATIFCCMPFGVAGIIFAARVETLWAEGRYVESIKASKDAGKWTKISIFVALGWWVMYCLFWMIFGISLMSTGFTNYI